MATTTEDYKAKAEPFLKPKNLIGNQGYICIAEIPETGHTKVGRSKTPTRRIKHFDTIMPLEVRVVSWFYADDYVAAEAWLHDYLKDYRIKGEWFDIPEMVIYNLLNTFCYIDGIFHMTQDINKDCCEQAIYDFVKDAIESGEFLRTVDHLPY